MKDKDKKKQEKLSVREIKELMEPIDRHTVDRGEELRVYKNKKNRNF